MGGLATLIGGFSRAATMFLSPYRALYRALYRVLNRILSFPILVRTS